MTQTPSKPTTQKIADNWSNPNPDSSPSVSPLHAPQDSLTNSPEASTLEPQTFWWQRLSLKAKAAIIVVTIGIVPVVATGFIGYSIAQKSMVQQIKQESQDDAITLAEQIKLFIAERYDDIQLLANLPVFSDPQIATATSTEEKQKILADYVQSTGTYQDAILFNLNGDAIIHSQGKSIPNHKNSPYVGKVLQTGRPFIYKPSAAKLPKGSIKIVAPVKDQTTGKMIGVIRLGMPVNNLDKVVDAYSLLEKDYKLIDDFDAYFIAPDAKYIGKNPKKEFQHFSQKTLDQKAHTWKDISQITGQKILGAYAPINNVANFPDLNWGVIIEADTKTILAAQRQLLFTIAVGTSVASLLWALIAVLLANRLTRPIVQATNALTKIGQGEWDTRLKVSGTDELGQLGTNINRMSRQLQQFSQQQTDLVEKSRWLAKISGMVATNEKEIRKNFDQILGEAKEMLGLDRLVIYRFNDDWSGYIANEAVSAGWPVALNETINDPCISAELLEAYRNGRVVPTEDVFAAGFHPDHQQLMTRLQIKANLVVPVINQGQLFGLLIGHYCRTTHQWQEEEINFMRQLAGDLGSVLDRVSLLQTQVAENKRSQVLKDLVLKLIGLSQTNIIFNTAVEEIRQALQCDRVIIYEFDENWQGLIIAESVDEHYPQALGAYINDPCFTENYVDKYRQGRVQATDNIHNAGLTQCHLQQLEPFAVQANLVAPIVVDGELLGLLIAHHCESPRHWQQPEIDFMTQAAIQIGVILERANLIKQQAIAQEEQRIAKEMLQARAMELIMEVEPISHGDLTTRAKITEDEIGTIADSYNVTVDNLRRLVLNVKTAAQQFSNTTENNEQLIKTLAEEALKQVEQITVAGDRLTAMNHSINLVAQNAEQTLMAFQQASETVVVGENAMNETVEGMLAIKDTVSQTTKKIQHLGESSQKISKVVSLISRFAAQTHLLALKASIEAARAGEEGRGFAVIADEVRGLATSSAEATAEIETLVNSIQTETKEVTQTMKIGTEQVEKGTELVEQTRRSLQAITVASEQINELVRAISQATEEQSLTSESMNKVMGEVSAITHNTSVSATQLADSFQEVLALAQQLQANVKQFKVN